MVDVRNTIDEYLEQHNVRERIEKRDGISVELIRRKFKRYAVLDAAKDAPLPQWAIDVLCFGDISYKGRKEILIEHNRNIFRYKKGITDAESLWEERQRYIDAYEAKTWLAGHGYNSGNKGCKVQEHG